MMRHSLVRFAAILVLVLAACQDSGGPSGPIDSGGLVPSRGERSGAPDQVRFARSVPGFGGVFVDRDGIPTAYLTDPSQRGAAQRALAGYLGSRGIDVASLRVRRAEFDLLQLDRWFLAASREVLGQPEVVYIDLDEAANRLTIGVLNEGGAAAARATIARLGIPDAAVQVVETKPIQFMATLRDRIRPVEGGVQIHFHIFLCSLGFNAVDGGQNSFVTASHCTKHQGGVEDTEYFQPRASVEDSFIGTEVEDPTYFIGGDCPRGFRCRYSDSARAAYAPDVSHDLGEIARTSGPDNRSLEIVGSFRIRSQTANPVVGEIVNKVGRTTGWTSGRVTATCVDTGVAASSFALLCQSFVQNDAGSAVVGGGDSGSAVFAIDAGPNVSLYGVLWGGSSDNTLFVFSPMSGIERELGALRTS